MYLGPLGENRHSGKVASARGKVTGGKGEAEEARGLFGLWKGKRNSMAEAVWEAYRDW